MCSRYVEEPEVKKLKLDNKPVQMNYHFLGKNQRNGSNVLVGDQLPRTPSMHTRSADRVDDVAGKTHICHAIEMRKVFREFSLSLSRTETTNVAPPPPSPRHTLRTRNITF